jgi:hypothetical protein
LSEAIFTLYERDYHYGVAALINSALASGFTGRFVVGFRDKLPPWTALLQKQGDSTFSISGRQITFYREDPPRHLGYHKPFAALSILEKFPEIETLYYADPDITLLAPWEFFIRWASPGLGVVQDVNFREMDSGHPWRREWEKLIGEAGHAAAEPIGKKYPNGGYFSVTRAQAVFLEIWRDLTLAFERRSGDTNRYRMSARCEAVVSDQDLLAATLLAWQGPVSFLGPEAMGFTGYFFILSHAVESPKPWAKGFLREALRGFAPSRPAKEYLKFSNLFIRTSSRARELMQQCDYRAGQLVSRFYRRGI